MKFNEYARREDFPVLECRTLEDCAVNLAHARAIMSLRDADFCTLNDCACIGGDRNGLYTSYENTLEPFDLFGLMMRQPEEEQFERYALERMTDEGMGEYFLTLDESAKLAKDASNRIQYAHLRTLWGFYAEALYSLLNERADAELRRILS